VYSTRAALKMASKLEVVEMIIDSTAVTAGKN
jgi:hypothetical protein